MQSRIWSFIESAVNLALGFLISLGVLHAVAWLYDLPVTTKQNIEITTIFTVTSFARSYLLRRLFNWLNWKKNDTAQRTVPSQDHDRRGGAW